MEAKRIRHVARSGRPGTLFPLTPALSPGERENHRQRLRETGTRVNVKGLPSLLPLPKGEGWGEGEDDTRQAAAADVSKLSFRR
jgi:hypothetical protein